MAKRYPSAEAIRTHLAYDPETGAWTRRVGAGRWKAGQAAGKVGAYGYWFVHVDGVNMLAHRAAFLYMTGALPPQDVDHINGDRLDNRWSNLRAVSRAENLQNIRRARKDNRAGLLGVSRANGDGSWRARLTAAGVLHDAGCFATAEQAHAAYLSMKRSLHSACTI